MVARFPRVRVLGESTWAESARRLVASRGYLGVAVGNRPDAYLVQFGPSMGLSAADVAELRAGVESGTGLVVVCGDPSSAQTETGIGTRRLSALLADTGTTDLAALLADAGVALATANSTPAGEVPTVSAEASPEEPAGVAPAPIEPAAAPTIDLLARVRPERLTTRHPVRPADPAAALLQGPEHHMSAAAVSTLGLGRVVVLGVDGPTSDELVLNSIAHCADRGSVSTTTPVSDTARLPAWLRLKAAVADLQALQASDGAVPDAADLPAARRHIDVITDAITDLAPRFPHDADYLAALVKDFVCWSDAGCGVPDFLDSLVAFQPATQRVDHREHLVVFPMYTQNGSPDRHIEAVLIQVIWPDFVDRLERTDFSNRLFVPIRFLDFTAGYDTNSAVLFPETVAMRTVPAFTWGAIFADREAARFRRVVSAATEITQLALPPDAAWLLADQRLAEETFVLWDLIHDRTHMRGDLPFDPFMVKQRMPYFLYALEELRCDLTAYAEAVRLEAIGEPHARLVQYAIIFDRIFRFAVTGSRVRNYDGLGGQLLFAWLHQSRVLHWTDNRLTIDWSRVSDAVLELRRQIGELYWRSIDRPKVSHWLAAYGLVAGTLTPHPASVWAKGPDALPVDGPPRGLTDAVLPDEFPLSMFYEALRRKLSPVLATTSGITG